VVLFWLATTSWLVKQKVLPPLLVGEPPSLSRIAEAQVRALPTGWNISCDGRRRGWALSDVRPQPSGMRHMHGWVHLDPLVLKETFRGLLGAFSQLLGQPFDGLSLDARSLLAVDPLGRLVRFDSTVRFGSMPEVISVSGTAEGNRLQIQVHAWNASFRNEAFLPPHALPSDALSPQTHLPGLRVGQTWTVPVFSPLRFSKDPLEIIYATVERTEPVEWNGAEEDAWLVVYRTEPGQASAIRQAPRGKLWVRQDRYGTVLRQQAVFFDTTITFDRLPDGDAVELADRHGPEWWSDDHKPQAQNHD
jgi:hypothetical protein